jgi:hypothetical protein
MVLANSMTKRVVTDYAAQPKWWQPLVVKTAIGDFKQRQRIHLNDFAPLRSCRTAAPACSWLTQDSVFTDDAISGKIRHACGGGFLDYRGGCGAIVP